MTINPELEIVATRHAPGSKTHTYVVARGDRRWSVEIPDADFERFGPVVGASAATNRMGRRKHLAMRLEAAMQGPADGED